MVVSEVPLCLLYRLSSFSQGLSRPDLPLNSGMHCAVNLVALYQLCIAGLHQRSYIKPFSLEYFERLDHFKSRLLNLKLSQAISIDSTYLYSSPLLSIPPLFFSLFPLP